MFSRFILTVTCLFFSQLAWAQHAAFALKGRVVGEAGQPVSSASIVIEGTRYGTITDAGGRFEFRQVPAGTYQVRALLLGFQSNAQQVHLHPDETEELTFTLLPKASMISQVEVFGEKDQQPEKLDAITRLPLKPSDQIQSISVISDKLIQQQGALTISAVTRNVPGVYTFATYGNKRESMSSRGFRGIPILKNGVRVNSDFRGIGVLTDMAGVESMQVLKGAAAITQGVATDLGSPGGVINIVTKTPRFEQGGYASLRVGSFGQVRPSFDVYGPVNESKTVAFRVAGAYEHADSYRRGISLDKLYINPSLEWRPDSKTRFILEMDYMDDSRTPDLGTVNLAPNDVNAIYDLPYSQFLGFKSDRAITRNATFAARFNRDLNNKLTLKGAYYRSNLDIDDTGASLAAGGGRGAALPALETYNLRYRTVGQSTRTDNNSVLQLDLVGQDVYTGPFKHTFQAGVDFRTTYLETASRSQGALEYIDIIDVFAAISNKLPAAGFVYIPAVKDPEGNTITPATTAAQNITLTAANPVIAKNTAFGLMVQDVVNVTDWAKVFLGIRYSSAESSGSESIGVIRGSAFNPQFGLMFSPLKGVNVFGSYTSSTSLRGASNLDVNGNELGNSRSDQLEAGIKSDWLDNRLRFNLTLYKINNKNLSLPVYDANWNETGRYQKGGNDERKGIEAELTGRVLENLEIIAGYAYIDAQYKEHVAYQPGSAPLNTPKHTANGWLSYTINSGHLTGLNVGAGVYYIGKRPINDWATKVTHQGIVPNQKPFYVQAYTTVNAQVGYNFAQHWGVRVLFNNIFDEIGYNAYRTSWINQTDPRNFAGTLTYRF